MQANGAASLQDGLACDVGDAQEDVDSARALVARLQAILGADLSAQALDAGCNLHGLGGSAQRGSVGVYLQGTTVVDFVPGSPAAKCGLKKGDRILQVDGKPIDAKSVSDTLMGDQDSVAVVQVQRRRNSALASPLQSVSSLFDTAAPPETHALRIWRQAPQQKSPASGREQQGKESGSADLAEAKGDGKALHRGDAKGEALEKLLVKMQAETSHLLLQLDAHLSKARPRIAPHVPAHVHAHPSNQARAHELTRRVAELEASLSGARLRLGQAEVLVKRLANDAARAMLECRRVRALHLHLGDLEELASQVQGFAEGDAGDGDDHDDNDDNDGAQARPDTWSDEIVAQGCAELPITLFSSRSPQGRGGGRGGSVVGEGDAGDQPRRITVQLPGDSGEDEEEGREEESQTGCTDEGGMPQYSRQVRLQVTRCQELITAIETSAARSLIPPQSPVALPELQTTATTLGLAYNSSRVVTRVLIGGPAFLCGAIAEGDMLEAINGVALGMQGEREGEDVATMLTGSDEPGSQCHVSFKSLASGHTQTVVLTRMANDAFAHKRQMMAAQDKLKKSLRARDDGEALRLLQVIQDLWTKTMLEQHVRDEECASNVAAMQAAVSDGAQQLRRLLSFGLPGGAAVATRHVRLGAGSHGAAPSAPSPAAWPRGWSMDNSRGRVQLNAGAGGTGSTQDIQDALALVQDRLHLVQDSLAQPRAHATPSQHALQTRIAGATLVVESLCSDLATCLVETKRAPAPDARRLASPTAPAAGRAPAVQLPAPPSPATPSSAGHGPSGRRTWSSSAMFGSSLHRRRQQKTTVGLLLHECAVETVFFNVVGAPLPDGPKAIRKGDVILAVDGRHVDKDSVAVALTGNDIPGSYLRLDVMRESGVGAERLEVTLTRMPTEGGLLDSRIRLLDMLFAANQHALVEVYDDSLGVEAEYIRKVCTGHAELLRLGSRALAHSLDLLEMNQLLCAELQKLQTRRAQHEAQLPLLQVLIADLSSECQALAYSLGADSEQGARNAADQTMAHADLTAKIERLQGQVAAGTAREDHMLASIDSVTRERDQLAHEGVVHEQKLALLAGDNERLLTEQRECQSAFDRLERQMRAVDVFCTGFLAECEEYPGTQSQVLAQVAQHHVRVLHMRQQESQQLLLESKQDLLCVKEYARSLQLEVETRDAAKVEQDKHTESVALQLEQARNFNLELLDSLVELERGLAGKIGALECAAGVAARQVQQQWDSLKARAQMLVEMRADSSQKLYELQLENRAREEQQLRMKSLRAIRRLMQACLVSAFMTWKEYARERRRQRAVIHKITFRMKHVSTFAALQRWRETTTEKRAMVAKSMRVVMRWKLQAVLRCVEAWRELTAEEVRKRNLMQRILSRMLNRSLCFAMDLWQRSASIARNERAEEERRQAVMSRIVKRMLNQAQAAAWERWSTHVEELLRIRNLMDRILRRMLNAKMAAAFEQWHCNVSEKKTMTAKALKVVARWINQCVARTIDAWQKYTMEEARKRNLMARIVKRMQQRGAVIALDLWHANVLSVLQERAEEEWRKAVMQSVVTRMLHATLAAGFGRWADNVRELRRQQGIMKRVAMRMKNAGMFAALQRWRENTTEKKAMVAKSTRVVTRWKLQAVVRCLEAWRELTAEEVQKRRVMKKIVSRMLNRSLCFAMDLWRQGVRAARNEHAEEDRRQKLMSKIVHRMLNQAQAVAFERWRANKIELARQRGIMQRILRRMLNAKMSAACERWHAAVVEKKIMAAKVRTVVFRWVHQCAGQVIDAWHVYTVEEARKRNLMARIVQRMQSRCVVVALENWQWNVAETVGERAEEERRKTVMQRVVQRMQHGTLASGLLRWCEHVGELRRQREILEKVASRMRNGAVCKAFVRWNENAGEMRRQRSLLQRVALRMKSAGMSAAFARWQENIQETKAMEAKSTRVVMRWKLHAVVRCLEAWRELTAEEVRKRAVTERIVSRMLNRSLFFAMELWRENARENKAMAVKSMRVVMRWKKQAAVRCLEAWRELIVEEVQQRNLMQRIVSQMLNRSLFVAMDLWRQSVSVLKQSQAEEARRKKLMSKIVHRMLNQAQAAAFEQWRANVSEQACTLIRVGALGKWRRSSCCVVGELLRRVLYNTVSSSFEIWCDKVLDDRKMKFKTRKILKTRMTSAMISGFEAWSSHAAGQSQVKRKLSRACQKMKHTYVWTTFERWKLQSEHDRAVRSKIKKGVQRMMNRTLVKRYEHWRERTADEKRRKSRALKVVQRFKNRELSQGFELWRDQTLEDRHQKSKCLKVIQRIMNRCLVEAFERWRDEATEQKMMKVKASRVVLRLMGSSLLSAFERWRDRSREDAQMKAKTLKVIKRLMGGSLIMAFETWRGATQKKKKFEIKALRVVQRLVGNTFAAVFAGWRDRTKAERQLRVKEMKLLRRLMGSSKVSAFQMWCDFATQQATQKRREKILYAKALKLLFRLTHRKLMVALAIWHEVARDLELSRCALDSLAHRVMLRTLDGMFLSWRSQTGEGTTKLKIRASNILHLHSCMAASRWQQRLVSSAWCAWLGLLSDLQDQVYSRARATSMEIFCKQRVQTAAWVTWEGKRRTARRRRALSAKAVARWKYTCWMQWLEQRAERKRTGIMRRKALLHRQKGLIAKPVAQWRAVTGQAKHRQLRSCRAAARYRACLMVKFVRSWRGKAAVEAQRRWQTYRNVLRRRRGTLADVLKGWSHAAWLLQTERGIETLQKSLLKRIVWKRIRRCLADALLHWAADVWFSTSQRRRDECVLRYVFRGKLSQSFGLWLGMLEAQKSSHLRYARAESRWREHSFGRCLAAWLLYKHQQAQRRHTTRRIVCRNVFYSKLLCREFIACLRHNADTLKRERAQDQHRNRRLQRRILGKQSENGRRLLGNCFSHWSNAAEQAMKKASKTRLAVCKCRRTRLSVCVFAWHADKVKEARRRLLVDRLVPKRTKRMLAQRFCVWFAAKERKRVLLSNVLRLLRQVLCRCRTWFFLLWRNRTEHLKCCRVRAAAIHHGVCVLRDRYSSALLHLLLALWSAITSLDASDEKSVLTVGYCVEVALERDFEAVMLSDGEIQTFNEALLTGVCASLEIPRSCATVLCHQRGSVVANVILYAQDRSTSSTSSSTLGGKTAAQNGRELQRPQSARALAKQLAACVRMFGNTSVFSACGLSWRSARILGPVTRQVVDSVQTSICEQRQLLSQDGQGKVLNVRLARSNRQMLNMAARRNAATRTTFWYAWQHRMRAHSVEDVTLLRHSRRRTWHVLMITWCRMHAGAACARVLRKKEDRIKSRFRQRCQSLVFEEMLSCALAGRRLRARMRQIVAKSARQSLQQVVWRWRRGQACHKALLRTSCRVQRRGMHRLLVCALCTWTRLVEGTRLELAQKGRQQRLMSKIGQLCVAAVLRAWFQLAQVASRRDYVMQRVALRQQRFCMSAAVLGWQQEMRDAVLHHHIDKQHRAFRQTFALQKVESRQLRSSLARWRDTTAEQKRLEAVHCSLKAKLASRRSSSAAASSCQMWAAHTAHARSSQAKVCLARRRFAGRQCCRAVCLWREGAQCAARARQRVSRICSRARWASARVNLEAWRRCMKRRMVLVSKSAKLRDRRNIWWMHAALWTWHREATHAARQRQEFNHLCGRGQRLQRRFRLRLAGHAIVAWQLCTASQARMRRKLAAFIRRREVTASLACMRRSWNSLKQIQCADQARHSEQMLRGILLRTSNRHLRRSLKAWQMNVEATKAHRVFSALRHAQLEFVATQRGRQFAVGKVLSILQTYARQQHTTGRAARGLQERRRLRSMNELLLRCLGTWLATTADAAAHQERSAAQRDLDECFKELEACRRDLTEAKSSARQLQQDLAIRTGELAEETLQKTVLEAKNKKRYLSRQHLASRLLCRDKLRVLSAWHALVLRTKCSLNKAHKRRLLLQGKLAAASFHCWTAIRHKNALLETRRFVFGQCRTRTRLVRALCEWQLVSAHLARLRCSIVGAARRRKLDRINAFIPRAFALLLRHVERAHERRQQEAGWTRRKCAKTLVRWRHSAQHTTTLTIGLERIAMRCAMCQVRSGLTRWRHLCLDKERERRVVRLCQHRHLALKRVKGVLILSVESWGCLIGARRRYRHAAKTIAGRCSLRILRSMTTAWLAWIAERRLLVRSAHATTLRCKSQRHRWVFFHWLQTQRAKQVRKRLGVTLQVRQSRGLLTSFIEHWRVEACSQMHSQQHSFTSARIAARLQARFLAVRARGVLFFWRSLVPRRRWRQSRTLNVRHYCVRRTCLQTLSAWLHATLQQRAFQRQARKATDRHRQQQHATAVHLLCDWLCAARVRRRRRCRQGRSERLRDVLLLSALAGIIAAWRQLASATLRLRGSALRVQWLLCNRVLVRLFATWGHFYCCKRLTRFKASAFCLRLRRAAVARAFVLWRHSYSWCLWRRDTACRIARSSMQKQEQAAKRAALGSWLDSALLNKQARARAHEAFVRSRATSFCKIALAWLREYRLGHLLRKGDSCRCVAMVCGARARAADARAIRLALGAWIEELCKLGDRQRGSRQIRSRRLLRCLNRFFGGWFERMYSTKVSALCKQRHLLMGYVGKIGQEAAALGSALKSQAQDLVEEFRKTARELTELEGHRVWLESELESSVIRETDAVAAMAAYKAQLLRDTELERGCANGLVKALFDALWLAQEAINTLLCDCECDARPSVAADDSRGAGDRGDAEDGAGRRALVRLIPPPAAQQLEVQCEAELPAVPNVEETREQTVLDAQERVSTFLASVRQLHATLARSEHLLNSEREEHAREKMRWSSEKFVAQSHARSLHEKLQRAEMQVAALSSDNAELMHKTVEDSQRLIAMQHLSHSMQQVPCAESDSRLHGVTSKHASTQHASSQLANGAGEGRELMVRDWGGVTGGESGEVFKVSESSGNLAGKGKTASTLDSKAIVSRLALGGMNASETKMRGGERQMPRLNKPWTPMTTARSSTASESGEGVDGTHAVSMRRSAASAGGDSQQNALSLHVSALRDEEMQLHEIRRDQATSWM